MKMFFHYNWMVRGEWYRWCEGLTEEELLQRRTGGMGSILKTLFHIADVEWSWIRLMEGKSDFQEDFEKYSSLKKVRELDTEFRKEVEDFVDNWNDSMEHQVLTTTERDGSVVTNQWGEVMRHIIAHEIHHIGQLSIWAREMGREPVSANLVGRDLAEKK